MKIITKVEWLEVEGREHVLRHMRNPQPEFMRVDTSDGERVLEAVEVYEEVVRGVHLKNPSNGVDMVLGMSVQAAEVIGCAYEAFEELQECVEAQRVVTHKFRRVITEIRQASFMTRLKWLFTGVKYEL